MVDPRELAESLVEEVRGAVGSRLRAATLFGSAARGEWIEGVSDVNVLILLDSLDAALLARAAPAVAHAMPRGVTPLVMELDEWRRAADVFAIELADMQEAGILLFGDDPAAGTPIQPSNLRLQAERELRAKLLHLHAGMLVAADDAPRLGGILVHALPSFTTYLRAALRLAQQPVPSASSAVIERGCALAGADPSAFTTVLDARTAADTFEVKLSDPLADEFNTAATRLATYMDAFEG